MMAYRSEYYVFETWQVVYPQVVAIEISPWMRIFSNFFYARYCILHTVDYVSFNAPRPNCIFYASDSVFMYWFNHAYGELGCGSARWRRSFSSCCSSSQCGISLWMYYPLITSLQRWVSLSLDIENYENTSCHWHQTLIVQLFILFQSL
jgi:hypothetical protein